MNRLQPSLLGAMLIACLPCSEARAQLVQVAPGYVKAPFVRVYSYPNGGSYVRAPFVSVYSPGYTRGHGIPSGPNSSELVEMDWRVLSQVIRASAAQLDMDLNHIASGDTWRSRLQVAEVASLLSAQSELPPSGQLRQQLRELSQTYAELDGNQSQSIANLRSFQVLQQALTEYVKPPAERSRQQLYSSAGMLNRALGRFTTGAAWQDYLTLSSGSLLAADRVQNEGSADSIAEYAELLERFESVGQNSDFQAIANLAEFKATRERLADYLRQLEASSGAAPEELPLPAKSSS